MKFVWILCMITSLQAIAFEGYTQNALVSIHMENVRVENILKEIEKQSEYRFFYDATRVHFPKAASVNWESVKVSDALAELFGTHGVTYRLLDKQIVLFPADKESATAQQGIAQQGVTVTGKVVDETGQPLPGVNVVEKGTTNGVVTDMDGKYTIKAASENSILSFSFVGYATQEHLAGSAGATSITLKEDSQLIGEVVVTALGIKRETKSLTYNVQEIKAKELTEVKDASFVNSLAGKIAGVTINSSSSGIGGSTRVVMRGTGSLFSNNNALYVIDGIPLPELKTSQSSEMYEMPDGGDGDGISNINPEDIESISVLTGSAAAALYGSQGGNGVILITTKKGAAGKTSVTFSNNTSFMSPFVMPRFQNTYGSSGAGSYYSWGDKLETPTNYDPKDFFQTGTSTTNTLSLSTGNDRNQTYVSISALNANGMIPNNEFNRYNFTFRNTSDLIEDKLTLDVNASYINQNDQNMLAQGQFHNPLLPLYLFPRGDDMEKYKVYERYNPERRFNTQFWPYATQGLGMENPYWIVNREFFNNKKNRYMFGATLKYNITDWLNIAGRARFDNSATTFTRKMYASTATLFASETGNYLNQQSKTNQTYADVIANANKQFGDIGLMVNMGASFSEQKYELGGYEGNLLNVPNLFSFGNINKLHSESKSIEGRHHDRSHALFATAQLDYKRLVFLDLTGRNDWYSSLANTSSEKSGFFYPSVGLSAIVSDILGLPASGILSYAKVRGSYSEVGYPPSRYVTIMTYPLADGTPAPSGQYPFDDLKPERTKSYEMGINLKFLENKVNLDFTYYNSNTYNQIFRFTPPSSSGYTSYYLNAGKVNNYGIEATLGLRQPIGPVTWTSNLVWTLNRNVIRQLIPPGTVDPIEGKPIENQDITVCSAGNGAYKVILKEGAPMGEIYTRKLKTDANGYIKVDPQSGAISVDASEFIRVGNTNPKYNLGFRNSFAYKGFQFDFLIDARVGGIVTSATQAMMDQFGVSETSAKARDEGGVLINGARVPAEKFYAVVGGSPSGVLSYYTYSATNVRLREMMLSYQLPSRFFNDKLNITVALTGRNLFMFYNKAPYDPEISASTGTYYQGYDYFMPPSMRSIGFNVRVQF